MKTKLLAALITSLAFIGIVKAENSKRLECEFTKDFCIDIKAFAKGECNDWEMYSTTKKFLNRLSYSNPPGVLSEILMDHVIVDYDTSPAFASTKSLLPKDNKLLEIKLNAHSIARRYTATPTKKNITHVNPFILDSQLFVVRNNITKSVFEIRINMEPYTREEGGPTFLDPKKQKVTYQTGERIKLYATQIEGETAGVTMGETCGDHWYNVWIQDTKGKKIRFSIDSDWGVKPRAMNSLWFTIEEIQ